MRRLCNDQGIQWLRGSDQASSRSRISVSCSCAQDARVTRLFLPRDQPLRWSLRPLDATKLEEIDVDLDVLDDAGDQAAEAENGTTLT